MPQHFFSTLSAKAAIGIAAAGLGLASLGAATSIVPSLISDSVDIPAPVVDGSTTDPVIEDTTDPVIEDTTDPVVEDTTDPVVEDTNDEATHEHPDNFGAVVSSDAHDGGVDGQEISQMAHDRNEARRTANGSTEADDETATEGDQTEATNDEADTDETAADETAADETAADGTDADNAVRPATTSTHGSQDHGHGHGHG